MTGWFAGGLAAVWLGIDRGHARPGTRWRNLRTAPSSSDRNGSLKNGFELRKRMCAVIEGSARDRQAMRWNGVEDFLRSFPEYLVERGNCLLVCSGRGH